MRCAGVASAALDALVLVALLPGALSGCESDTSDVTIAHPSCTRLAEHHRDSLVKLSERCVSVNGQPASVTLYWGSDPARAAATLLRVLLRDVLRYRRVRTAQGPHNTAELAKYVTFDPNVRYTDLVIGVSTALQREVVTSRSPSPVEGPLRLRDFGGSPVSARRRLHAWLAPAARSLRACRQLKRWKFYVNATVLELCGFVDDVHYQGNVPAAEVLGVGDCNGTLRELSKRARAAALPLHMRRFTRAELLRAQRAGNHSFLFLDYDIWQGEPGVNIVEPPPCVSAGPVCEQELDSAISIRVADVQNLKIFAPELFQFVRSDFKPTPKSLRWILEQEANGVDIEEAVCKWSLKQKYVIERDVLKKFDQTIYYVAIYLCNPLETIYYKETVKLVRKEIVLQTTELGIKIASQIFHTNCSDAYDMSKRLDDLTKSAGFRNILGVMSQTVEGAALAAVTATEHHVPLLLVDVVPDDDTLTGATWRVSARPRHVARALQYFVQESHWTRVAVLSEPTSLAKHYFAALQDDAKFALGDFSIPLILTELQAKEVLEKLQDTNARIVLVNAVSESAVVILTAAFERHMSYEDGFVWIVRDWRPNDATSSITHFTISPWSRVEEGIPNVVGRFDLRMRMKSKWLSEMWPSRAISYIDALLTLTSGFRDIFKRYPDTRHDIHTAHVIGSLNESLVVKPVLGVNQLLQYKDGSLEETFVYVDEWRGATFTRLATWRVNATSGAVRGNDSARATYTRSAHLPRHDGCSRCILRGGGNAFDPDCYDAAWIFALLLLAVLPIGRMLDRRAQRRRFALLQQMQKNQALAAQYNTEWEQFDNDRPAEEKEPTA